MKQVFLIIFSWVCSKFTLLTIFRDWILFRDLDGVETDNETNTFIEG